MLKVRASSCRDDIFPVEKLIGAAVKSYFACGKPCIVGENHRLGDVDFEVLDASCGRDVSPDTPVSVDYAMKRAIKSYHNLFIPLSGALEAWIECPTLSSGCVLKTTDSQGVPILARELAEQNGLPVRILDCRCLISEPLSRQRTGVEAFLRQAEAANQILLVIHQADVLLQEPSLVNLLVYTLDNNTHIKSGAFVVLSCDCDAAVPDVLTVRYRLGTPLVETPPSRGEVEAALMTALADLNISFSSNMVRVAQDQTEGGKLQLVEHLTELARGLSLRDIQAALRTALEVHAGTGVESSVSIPQKVLEQALREAPRPAWTHTLTGSSSSSSSSVPPVWQQLVGEEVSAALDEVAAITSAVCDPAQQHVYAALGIRPCSGVLIAGPSGVGKTTVARQIAAQATPLFSFLEASCAELVHKVVGESERRIGTLFAEARQRAPTFLLLDNLDVLLGGTNSVLKGEEEDDDNDDVASSDATPSRSQRTAHKALDRVLSMLLMEIDGLEGGSGTRKPSETVVVLATVTDERLLDDALLRPGRLEHRVTLDLPSTAEARHVLLTHFLKDCPLKVDVPPPDALPPDASPADLRGMAEALKFECVARAINGK